jgi:uncharacterized protein (DUF58 family)
MRRSLLLGFLIYVLLLLGLGMRLGGLLVLALPLILYLAAALIYRPAEPTLEITRHLSADRVNQGTPVEVTLSITNQGPALEEVHLEDLLPEPLIAIEGSPLMVTSLSAGESLEMSYTLATKRGFYQFPGVQVSAFEHLGVLRQTTTIPAPGQLLVMPPIPKLRRIVIRPQRTRVYSGIIPARLGGPGVEFYGVREYEPGDPLRWINWRASARHTEGLFINEFEQERAADVGLILDTRRRSYIKAEEENLFEYAVQATAALADAFLKDGNRVGLLLYGDVLDWTFPGYGKIQRERILRSLAQAKLGESLYFDEMGNLPTRLFPAHSQIVLISPMVRDDLPMLVLLRARGYQLLVISPDPISFERKALWSRAEVELGARIARLERELLLRELRQAGVRLLDWPVETPFEQAAHAALGRQPIWFQAVGVEP